jgi:hypothetical protein
MSVNEADVRPNEAEKEFLIVAYNHFYDIYTEILADSFWARDSWYRLSKIKDVLGVYAELLKYEPIKGVVENLRKTRPPMEAEISGVLLKFIRNVVFHFPFFEQWDDIWISRQVVNWNTEGQFIDRFIKKYEGQSQVKYRFWEEDRKEMTYLSINFPNTYSAGEKIFLKDMVSEKDGVKFLVILMRKILDTQVET